MAMYLRRIGVEGAGIDPGFLQLLTRALAHYNLRSLEPSDTLERAVLRLYATRTMAGRRSRVIVALLHLLIGLAERGETFVRRPELALALDGLSLLRGGQRRRTRRTARPRPRALRGALPRGDRGHAPRAGPARSRPPAAVEPAVPVRAAADRAHESADDRGAAQARARDGAPRAGEGHRAARGLRAPRPGRAAQGRITRRKSHQQPRPVDAARSARPPARSGDAVRAARRGGARARTHLSVLDRRPVYFGARP